MERASDDDVESGGDWPGATNVKGLEYLCSPRWSMAMEYGWRIGRENVQMFLISCVEHFWLFRNFIGIVKQYQWFYFLSYILIGTLS